MYVKIYIKTVPTCIDVLSFFSNFRRVLNMVCFLLDNSPASQFCMPTFNLHRSAYEDGADSVPKRRHIKLRRRGITYSMAQSLSWEANWFAASQEIPRISRNPKVHYRTHKRPPTVSILSQPNPVHIPTSHLLEIHPNIIHPPTPRSTPVVSFPPVSPARPYTPPFLTICPAHLTDARELPKRKHTIFRCILHHHQGFIINIFKDISLVHQLANK